MARKTRKIGVGFYFGYGGKKKWWQTWRECAVSEVRQESGIKIKKKDLEYIGIVDFYNGDEQNVPFGKPSFRVACYRVCRFVGEPIPTEEMVEPRWFPVDQIPFDTPDMKPGDELFVPYIVHGVVLPDGAYIRFDSKTKNVVRHNIPTLKTLP